jgi:transposase InsO family protein
MTVASFVAAQRTDYGVAHVISCRALELSESWFYKWRDRPATPRQQRRVTLDDAVKRSFDASGGRYGSPRVLADLVEDGWRVSKKSVEASMARQGLVARPTRTRRGWLTRPDKAAPPVPDLVKRDFTAPAINLKWCGDLTEVPTDEGKLYLATVEDLASRRIVGFGLSEHHDAELATSTLKMAVAVRGGDVAGTIFHTDRGSEYTATLFEQTCKTLAITQSMGRAGSCFDNAAAESFFSTVEWELFRKRRFETKQDARREVAWFIDWYNRVRRHSSCEMKPPIEFEAILAAKTLETLTENEAA